MLKVTYTQSGADGDCCVYAEAAIPNDISAIT